MRRLRPEKLSVARDAETAESTLTIPRRYTLTHSDSTGDLKLSIGEDYSRKQTSGLYTRLMRDEVLAEWRLESGAYSLHVYCHVSGGLVFGTRGMREGIFLREMPLVLEAIRYGDRGLFESNKELDQAPITVHLQASGRDYKVVEFDSPGEYR